MTNTELSRCDGLRDGYEIEDEPEECPLTAYELYQIEGIRLQAQRGLAANRLAVSEADAVNPVSEHGRTANDHIAPVFAQVLGAHFGECATNVIGPNYQSPQRTEWETMTGRAHSWRKGGQVPPLFPEAAQ